MLVAVEVPGFNVDADNALDLQIGIEAVARRLARLKKERL